MSEEYIKTENNALYIGREDIIQYLERLTKNRQDKAFIYQYLSGDGQELGNKFWNVKSSSRMAFDLYSWIPSVEFEKKLPGVICIKDSNNIMRTAGVPNMDVFFKSGNDDVYIESKFTECASWSYTHGKKPNLSKAYWYENNYAGMNAEERFYGHKEISDAFIKFCQNVQKEIDLRRNDKTPYEWFDPKQETCHLFGIIFELLNAKIIGGKPFSESDFRGIKRNVHLVNVIYKMDGDVINESGNTESLPSKFKFHAEQLIANIGLKNVLSYDFRTVQDVISNGLYGLNFKDSLSFGLGNKTVEQQMSNYEWASHISRAKLCRLNKKDLEHLVKEGRIK